MPEHPAVLAIEPIKDKMHKPSDSLFAIVISSYRRKGACNGS